jgi:hypothetical protein
MNNSVTHGAIIQHLNMIRNLILYIDSEVSGLEKMVVVIS